jgi:hypothetical protein
MELQTLIQSRFSGAINNEAEYIELIMQAITILILGIVMWRLMMLWHKRKQNSRKESEITRARYSNKWKG